MNITLPPLRRLIFRGYVFIVGIFGVGGGILLLWTVVLATNITPRLLHRNYDSINAALQMREAWHAVRHPTEHPAKSVEEFRGQFERALAFEKENLTERGEAELSSVIEKLWNQSKSAGAPDGKLFIQMNERLDHLIELNRAGMFKAAEEAQKIKSHTIKVAIFFFIVGLIVMFYRADSMATTLSDPLKRIAETLRGKPQPGEKLRLPTPNSLELRILIQEIRNLWDRVTEADRTNVEQIVRQSQKLRAVLASVEDAVLVLGERGQVSHCNDKMLSLLNLSQDQVIASFWQDLPSMSENYIKLRDILTPELSDERVFELKGEGGMESYSGRVRPVPGQDGGEIAKVYLLHNITEKRQRERLKSEFIGVLSHELKTPLQSLGTASELLVNRKSQFDEDTQLLVDTIQEDVSRIRGVTNDFVQVSHLENQPLSLKLQMEPLNLHEYLPRWLKPFRVVAQDKKVNIEYLNDVPQALVNLDPIKFPWVITNLLSNAIRVTPSGGKIRITLSVLGSEAAISVQDEGPGVAPEIANRIFEPYFKGASGPADPTAGFLGIGLTIAKEVIEAHGGKIGYRKGEPTGAIFSVNLPLVAHGREV